MRVVSTGMKRLPALPDAKLVGELDAHRPVLLGNDQWAQIMALPSGAGCKILIAPQLGCRQV